jgi:hypothetical protein
LGGSLSGAVITGVANPASQQTTASPAVVLAIAGFSLGEHQFDANGQHNAI